MNGWSAGEVAPDDREPCVPCYGTGLYMAVLGGYAFVERNREAIARVQSGQAQWNATYMKCGACQGRGYWRARVKVAVPV